jgi:threonine aldolase
MMKSQYPNLNVSSRRGLGSDNHSGVHPRVLDAIARVNGGHWHAYGLDQVSEKAYEVFREHFGPEAETHFVFNGTGANVLALSTLVRSHHAVLASQHAHLINDECGAPEKNLGAKIISVPSPDGKLTPESLKPFLIRRGDQHASQVRAISLTQPTELGTLYSLEELRRLTAFAREHRLLVHMDGARLVNATEALGCTFKEMTTDLGIDVVSFGGTKNALLFGEAVVILKPELAGDFKFARKQLMQLMSKTSFVAAQFLELLGTDLWRENASHANRMARFLSEGLKTFPEITVTQSTQSNAVFAIFPRAILPRLREEMFFYIWNEANFECRLMTSWDTDQQDLERFLTVIRDALASR